MNVLQLYYKMPFPMNDGGAYSIYQSSLSLLSQDVKLKVLAMDLQKSRERNIQMPADFVALTHYESVPVDNRVKPVQAFKNLFGSRSYFVGRFYSKAYEDKLAVLLQAGKFDVIHLEHLYLCLYLDVIRRHSDAKIILRAQNVENLLWYGYLDKVRNPLEKLFLLVATKRLEAFEKQMINRVDGIMALSKDDALYFRQHTKGVSVTDIQIGLDLEKYAAVDPEKQYKKFPQLFHLGSMDWKPNVLGMQWFVSEVLPLVIQKHPGIELVIAGKNMPRKLFAQKSRNLTVLGRVEDALRFQEDKAILVVPLLAGSGIRVKILEGMAMGKTIISTSIGAKGILFEENKNILIADTPGEFVAQISRCIDSESFCRALGENARQLVCEHYDVRAIGKDMVSFYSLLLQQQTHDPAPVNASIM